MTFQELQRDLNVRTKKFCDDGVVNRGHDDVIGLKSLPGCQCFIEILR
jgi:hypothetical protein